MTANDFAPEDPEGSDPGKELELYQRRFDMRHLIELYQRKQILGLPYELGVLPEAPPTQQTYLDLIEWGVLDNDGVLTPEAAPQFEGLIDYQWASFGTILLFNERRPVKVDLPTEFFDYGYQHAIRDVPRVTFQIGVRNDHIVTAILNGGQLQLSLDEAGHDLKSNCARVADFLMKILDPSGEWEPYPMGVPSFVLPAGAINTVLKDKELGPRPGDSEAAGTIATKIGEVMNAAGVESRTNRILDEMLRQEELARVEICLVVRSAVGKRSRWNNAVGLTFLRGKDAQGVAVSYPFTAPDGAMWITWAPATRETLATAIHAQHVLLGEATAEELFTPGKQRPDTI